VGLEGLWTSQGEEEEEEEEGKALGFQQFQEQRVPGVLVVGVEVAEGALMM